MKDANTSDLGTIAQHPLLAHLSDDSIAELAHRGEWQDIRPGTDLGRHGELVDNAYYLVGGVIRLYHCCEDGRELTSRLAQAPCVLGDIELGLGVARLHNWQAFSECRVLRLPVDVMREHLADTRVQQAHIKLLAKRAARLTAAETQHFASLQQRVAMVVLSYAELHGETTLPDGRISLGRSLSQRTLARAIGTVRRSAANVLKRWEARGMISYAGETLILDQPEAIQAIAGGLEEALIYSDLTSISPAAHSAGIRGTLIVKTSPSGERGAELTIDDQVLLGRRSPNGLFHCDSDVAALHARVYRGRTGRRFWVEDVDTAQGTFLNGKRVRRAVLQANDEIRIGKTTFRFELRVPEHVAN